MKRIYGIFYEVNGRVFSLVTQLGCINLSELHLINLYHSKKLLNEHYQRLILCSQGKGGKHDIEFRKPFLNGRVFIGRIGSKDCPVVLISEPHWQGEKNWPYGKGQDYALRVDCQPK